MQVFVENPNTIVIDVDQGRQGRGISNITYTEVSGQYFLIVTYTDGTTETLGPLVVTGGAAFLLGGTAGALPYQSAPNTTTFLPIGTANQVVVAGASAPQYTSNLTGLTVNNTPVGNTAPSTGAFTNLSASGTFALTGDQVQISEGGTGQTTANAAFNALAPSQTGNAGKYLKTDGTNSAWDQLDISTADITGTLPIANGGTGQTTANSALNALLPTQSAQSGKYLKTDGTNASWDQLDISTADITGVLAITNGGTGASTAPGARANLSAAVLGTNNDITSMTGVTGGISTPDFVQFDTTATEANAVGKVYWDANQGTLDLGLLGGNVITRIGQTLVAYVTNAEAVTITKGQVVYLFGAQGNRATVKLAYNTSDATSAKTFGVVAENIPANGTGFVMCQGVLEGLNLGAFTAGDTLYLGATPGSLTATKPYAPNHLVYVGLVERANAGNGQLYVKVQNGYELDEIHDVQIINPQNGQTIIYDASTSLWKNANLTAGSGIGITNGAASITVSNTGVLSFSGGTTGLTPATSTTGAVTLGGTLNVANGGTGATTAAGALTNLNAASQSTTITAGTGLTGGGDLSANRTISIANTTVTAGAYGSASNTLTATVNAQGQLTALAATPIAIANTQVSGLGTMSTQNSNSVTVTGGSITGITDLAIADGGTGASTASGARSNLGLGTAAVLDAGVALGVATLDAGGTVPLSQIPASIQGGVSYQGSWDASTNTPTIVSSVGTKGYYYVVSVAGSTNINGISDWLPGDWIIFNGSVWQKIDNTDAVASVNGYTGVVVLSAADVGAPPTSRTITAGTGLTGGGDLSANRTISIANTTVAAGSYGSASSVGTFTVNGQGQLTAAASTPIAITNTQVSGLGTMSTQNANSVAITGGSIDGATIGGTTRAAGSFTTLTLTNALGIANGGTGQTTANAAFNALAPAQTGNAGKYLTTDGTNTSWATNPLGTVTSVDVSGGTTGLTTSGGPITSSGTITLGGTLATTNGGTGLTSFTANRVFYSSSTSAIGSSANLTFDGTTLTANALTTTSTVTINGGTANGVAYLNGSKVLTTGSALTFDGANSFLGIGPGVTPSKSLTIYNPSIDTEIRLQTSTKNFYLSQRNSSGQVDYIVVDNAAQTWSVNNSEQMRLTTTGLGIGTSSPSQKLHVVGTVQSLSTSTTVADNVGFFAGNGGNGTLLNGITFQGAYVSNMYFGRSALADDLVARNGSSELLRITNGGSVGIGTSSPSYRLDVSSASTPVARFTGAANAYVDFSDGTVTSRLQNSGALLFGTTSNHSLLLRTNSTTQATLDTSGNLGLGVTPESWFSSERVMRIGLGAGFGGRTNTASELNLYANAYISTGGSPTYIANGTATRYAQDTGKHLWYTAASGTAGNTISFTQALTLNTNGALVLQGGNTSASGVGVAFPATQVASSDANTLDDYEEGTFTPVIVGTTSAGTGTYTVQNGFYTKIGNQVFIAITIRWTAHTGTGNMKITGLPFTSNGSGVNPATYTSYFTNIALTANNVPAALQDQGTSEINLRQLPTGGGAATNVPMDTSGEIEGLTGFYRV